MTSGDNGVITVPSRHSVDDTIRRLQEKLAANGVHIFALVDHSGEAAKTGLRMPNTKLVIFGSPKAGTPLMLAAPTIAIDLPLKVLVQEDAGGKVWVRYNDPEFLAKRHGVPPDLVQALRVAGALAAEIAE